MNCTYKCNRLCPHFIIGDSISIVTVNGTDTLVIDIPAANYMNKERYCIITAQSIPAAATTTMPVAVSIGGDTTTVYPLVCSRTCTQAVACQVRTRTKYITVVETNTTSGVFKVYAGLGNYCADCLASLPVAATAGTLSMRTVETPAKTTKTVTKTVKEVISNE